MRISSGLLILLLLFSSCSEYDKPENLIPEKKYIDLIVELHVAETTIETLRRDTLDRQKYVNQILQSHGVTYAQFMKSHRYYNQDLEAQSRRIEQALKQLKTRLTSRKDSTEAK